MKPGDVFGPVRGPSGFQLVKLIEQRDATGDAQPVTEFHARHILVRVDNKQSDTQARRARLEPYRVTPELMRLAAHDAVFLHCLPAHRGEEVDAAVIDGPQSLVWRQAANRLPTEQALLHTLVTGDWEA